jgi:hypothetical protein
LDKVYRSVCEKSGVRSLSETGFAADSPAEAAKQSPCGAERAAEGTAAHC